MANDNAITKAAPVWSPSIGAAAISALLGGLIGFAIVQPFDPFFAPTVLPEMGLNPTDEEVEQFIGAQKDFYGHNYAVELGIIGACIGLFFAGLTAPTKKIPSAVLAGILGAMGAGFAGYFAGGATGVELAWSKDQSLITAAMFNFLIWGGMAAGIALGASVFQSSIATLVKSILAGLIAAILVVIAIILVFSVAFPGANSSNYVPVSLVERVVWIVVASLTFGAAMSVGLKPAKSDQAGSAEVLDNV